MTELAHLEGCWSLAPIYKQIQGAIEQGQTRRCPGCGLEGMKVRRREEKEGEIFNSPDSLWHCLSFPCARMTIVCTSPARAALYGATAARWKKRPAIAHQALRSWAIRSLIVPLLPRYHLLHRLQYFFFFIFFFSSSSFFLFLFIHFFGLLLPQVDWKTNRKRCPLYLNELAQIDAAAFPDNNALVLAAFHRQFILHGLKKVVQQHGNRRGPQAPGDHPRGSAGLRASRD
jgi:hypothetical protein